MSSLKPQLTDFSIDITGRYVCNGLDEALHSMSKAGTRPDGSPQDDAQPFDIVVVGGGSFGGVFGQHLLHVDETNSHRILLLDAGRVSLPEHFQNLPLQTEPNEVWGVPWLHNVPGGFRGLAYTIGGRSLYFGGWSPKLLPEEMPVPPWPAQTVADLMNRQFDKAAQQIGTDFSNDFMFGDLHEALRTRLGLGIDSGGVRHAIPLANLPWPVTDPGANPPANKKLEAPLAVQGRPPLPGFFPLNKFSSASLIVEAARTAQTRSFGDDVKKRLMVVPDVHVTRLVTAQVNGATTVTAVLVHQQGQERSIEIPPEGKVVIALGTIESTRLALTSFPNVPTRARMGTNLMAHLRSNLTIRVPRSALPAGLPTNLESSALFLKGRLEFQPGHFAYFHLQITASGLDRPSTDSEAELFKKVPDVDLINALRQSNDTNVVITMRGIGGMEPQNPGSSVTLSSQLDEYSMPRAFVSLARTAQDEALWNAMDEAADDVAKVFANGQPYEVFEPPQGPPRKIHILQGSESASTKLPFGSRRDGMGTTHHEGGTLRMGEDAATSVTDVNARFHDVANAYAVGPALLSTLGSPNPMLSGVALARRLAEHLTKPKPQPSAGFELLFDGAVPSAWKMSTIKNQPRRDDPGRFHVIDAGLESVPGSDLGLFYTPVPFTDFILQLEWLTWRTDDNSGIFVRFPNPASVDYDNTAFVAVDFGFEVQIDALGRGSPPPGQSVDPKFRTTGALYNIPGQTLVDANVANGPGVWNSYEIRVKANRFTVLLNGAPKADYVNMDPARGKADPTTRFVGLQTHTGRVRFRNIQIKAHP